MSWDCFRVIGHSRRRFLAVVAGLASFQATGRRRVAAADLPSDPTKASATAMAAAIRGKKISCVELVTAHLERIETLNAQINAIVELPSSQALDVARKTDAFISGEFARINFEAMPCLGVPVTVKDNIATKGITSTDGSFGLRDYKPKLDAQVVKNLKSAGAIVLGKTNLPEAACFPCTDNDVHGRTSNPYALDRTVFGSSGGEAAAISACLSPMGVGTDMGGSVRLPAHACGITALKESWRRIPFAGLLLIDPISVSRLSTNVIGPMARTIDDLALLYPVLARDSSVDPFASPVPIGDLKLPSLKGLRVAYFTDDGNAPASPETRAVVERVADAMEDQGAVVEQQRPPGVEDTAEIVFASWGVDYAEEARRLLAETHGTPGDKMSALMRQGIEMLEQSAGKMSVAHRQRILSRFTGFQAGLNKFMRSWDIVVAPVAAVPALKHEETDYEGIGAIGLYTQWVNAGGLPAVSARGNHCWRGA